MFKILSIIICVARVSTVWVKNPLTKKIFITIAQVSLTTLILAKNEKRERNISNRRAEERSFPD